MSWQLFTPKNFISLKSGYRMAGKKNESLTVLALETDILRVSFLPDGQWRLDRTWMMVGKNGDAPREGRSREDLSAFSCPKVSTTHDKNQAILSTLKLRIDIQTYPFCIRYETIDGQHLALDDAFGYEPRGNRVKHESIALHNEHYYGLGEKSGRLNKAGRHFVFHNRDALGYSARFGDPLYKQFPFYICWRPDLKVAFGVLYDNLSRSELWLNQAFGSHAGLHAWQASGGDVDFYFILGPSIENVVEKVTRLTGMPVLPPRYSLGYLASSMGYTEGEDGEQRLDTFLGELKERNIPCDLFHLSSGYCKAEDGRRNVFTWNNKRFPNPKNTIQKFHKAGLKVSANIKPCLLTSHPQYNEVAEKGFFIHKNGGKEPLVAPFWGGRGSFIDFTNPAAWDWWQSQAKQEILDYGIDSLWNDNNEFEVPKGKGESHGFGKPINADLVSPIQTLLMTRASFEAQQKKRPSERPFTISRAGCPGMQRYAQTWTGDNRADWTTLKFNIPMGLGLGLSGMANYGHDVGGFFGRKPSQELFLRWVQQGIFMPRFCIHSWRLDNSANEPWMYPAILPLVREAMHLRYRLMPYLYSLFYESSQTGHPIQRPLVYAFPDDPKVVDESFSYMLGPSLLVSTITKPREKTHAVYLPAEQGWFDFWNGKYFEGGQTIQVPVKPESIPLYVRAGGMIPLGKEMQHVDASPDDERKLMCFPQGSGTSTFQLYEDDGISTDYQKGKYTLVELTMTADEKTVRVKGGVIHSGYSLPYKKIDVILPEDEKRKLVTEGLCRKAK
jgi:alpha-glucosidase